MTQSKNDVTGQTSTNTPASNSSTQASKESKETKANKQEVFNKDAHRQNLETAQNALVAEFHTLIADTERLLKFTQDTAGEQADEIRTKVNANLERARSMLQEREGDMRSQCENAMRCTEDYVQSRPWQSIGIAAGVGFLLGMITRR